MTIKPTTNSGCNCGMGVPNYFVDNKDFCPTNVMKAYCTSCQYAKACEVEELKNLLRKCQSPIEYWLGMALYFHNLTEGLCSQYAIELRGKKTIADFAYDPLSSGHKIAIYCDGYEYHSRQEALIRDRQMDRELQRGGWMVLRFTRSELLNNLGDCVAEIKESLKEDDN